jgi:hypothetical protein
MNDESGEARAKPSTADVRREEPGASGGRSRTLGGRGSGSCRFARSGPCRLVLPPRSWARSSMHERCGNTNLWHSPGMPRHGAS